MKRFFMSLAMGVAMTTVARADAPSVSLPIDVFGTEVQPIDQRAYAVTIKTGTTMSQAGCDADHWVIAYLLDVAADPETSYQERVDVIPGKLLFLTHDLQLRHCPK